MSRTVKYTGAFLLVSLLFLFWGVANNMNDTLLAAFKRIMSMSDLQTSFVQFAFFGAYFCIALPAALFIRRFSYKAGIILGLALYAVGTMLFYPAGQAASYPFFLFAIYVMACGCAVLETTANPFILSMGPAESATRRLNIAQTFNPIGAICGILLSRHFILGELNSADAAERAGMDAEALRGIQAHELDAISGTYMLLGGILLVLLVVIAFTRMPGGRDDSSAWSFKATLARLRERRRYSYGVLAQFFYVGVQTGVWSFTIRYVMACAQTDESRASLAFLASIVAFTLFRFFFTWLMKYVKPARLLTAAAVAGAACVAVAIVFPGPVGIAAVIAVSACMSLMFPTIYGIALEGIGSDDTKIAASGLIMAILGGAVITPVQALVSDLAGVAVSFSVPLVCFVVILIYSIGINHADSRNNR